MKHNITREKSAIELLRIILLFFLILTHIGMISVNYLPFLDTNVLHYISLISVTAFASITGIFIFNENSKPMFGRNINRLLFIIIFSIIFTSIVFKWTHHFNDIFNISAPIVGGRDVWYLYAILPTYFFAPFLKSVLAKYSNMLPTIVGVGIVLLITLGKNNFISAAPKSIVGTTAISSLFLFGIALISFGLINMKKDLKYLFITFIVLIISFYVIQFYLNINKTVKDFLVKDMNHDPILNVILAISTVYLVYQINWSNKYVNWFSKRSYFVYEYHWLVQMIWTYYFQDYTINNSHAAFYTSTLFVFSISLANSFILTEIQYRLWIPMTNPLFNWFQLKWNKCIKLNQNL